MGAMWLGDNAKGDVSQPKSRLSITIYPLLTVVVLCRAERTHIGFCLGSLLANDYPKDRLEILVVDGMSNDGTRDIIQTYICRYPLIRLLDNPKLITPVAMNIGVRNARGEVIAIVGAHSTYDECYLSECVKHLVEYGADQVGAVAQYIPREKTLVGRAIVSVLTHPFGAGTNVGYKLGAKEPKWVDTVSSGCYHRDVFDRIGLFNEELIHSQDIEFNLRLRRAGGKILLVPTAVIRYYARSDLKSFWKHNFRNGVWVILPFLYSQIIPVSLRHLVPLVFVTSLLGAILLGLLAKPFFWLSLVIIGSYILASLIGSFQIAWRERDIRYLIVTSFIFGMLHIGYGLGSLWGVFKLLGAPKFWNKLLRLVW
jgi:GT2 family glycosyltransferase